MGNRFTTHHESSFEAKEMRLVHGTIDQDDGFIQLAPTLTPGSSRWQHNLKKKVIFYSSLLFCQARKKTFGVQVCSRSRKHSYFSYFPEKDIHEPDPEKIGVVATQSERRFGAKGREARDRSCLFPVNPVDIDGGRWRYVFLDITEAAEMAKKKAGLAFVDLSTFGGAPIQHGFIPILQSRGTDGDAEKPAAQGLCQPKTKIQNRELASAAQKHIGNFRIVQQIVACIFKTVSAHRQHISSVSHA